MHRGLVQTNKDLFAEDNNTNMNGNIGVIFTISTENLPENFQDILHHERAVVAKWQEEGILEHFFLRQTRNGAVFIFKGIDEEQVRERIESLPLFPLTKTLELLPLIKQF